MLNLIIAAIKTGLGTVGMLVTGIITTKILALVTGPAGIGLWSLLRQAQQMGASVATLSGATALVQGISSRDGRKRDVYIQTVALLMISTMALVAVVMLAAAPLLAPPLLVTRHPLR